MTARNSEILHHSDQAAFRHSSSQKIFAPKGVLRCFVEGVKCSHCLQKIESAFKYNTNVIDVRMDMGQSVLTLNITPAAEVESLVATLNRIGFPATPLKFDETSEKSQKIATRQSLYRIGVAGVSAGNIMLLSVSLYAGAGASEFASYFEWVSALLFAPVLFYSAIPFYRVAWADLKKLKISIDLPIVLAIVVGSALSYFHLFRGGDMYFDSLAVLVFLLLSSRHFLAQLQHKYLNPKYLQSFLSTTHAEVLTNNGWETRPVEDLKAGDEIQLQQNQQIPADGTLVSSEGYINASVLTGESLPEKIITRQPLYAGTTWLSAPGRMVVEKTAASTRMGQIFSEMEAELLTKTPLITLTDKVAKYFTFAILVLAIGFFAVFYLIQPEEALRRSLALIILACPCALALATPLCQSLALMKATRLGAVIKNASALEALVQVKNIVFDKTGTLTTGQMQLKSIGLNTMTAEDELALVALESQSQHPVAYCLVDYFQPPDNLPKVHELETLSSGGLRAIINGKSYLAKKSASQEENQVGTSVDFFRDETLVAQFQFSDEIRATSFTAVEKLLNSQYHVHLLTGDLSAPSFCVGNQLGIENSNIHSSQKPEDKQQMVKRLSPSMMVGDGINDSVALAAADVGVSVHGSMKDSLAASDIYLTQTGVAQVPDLLILAQESYKVIQRNLGISVVYNSVFGFAALLGYVNPLVAAVLMPLSSVTVVISSVVGTKRLRKLTPPVANDSGASHNSNFPKKVREVLA